MTQQKQINYLSPFITLVILFFLSVFDNGKRTIPRTVEGGIS